ncbi:MAG TPA: TrmH family RNA methyltransferase [Sphingomicrobium sp.]|nr:TrmH family RNA methyltransferase [Sphingomicrobium sp.]
MSFYVYMLRCSDESYYVGHTEDLEARVGVHQAGLIAGYTHKRRPVQLVWSQDFPSREEALAAERRLKGWSRAKKEALIQGDWDAVQRLSRKLFLRYAASTGSAATQDERGKGDSQHPFVLSRGLSEAEGPVSKDRRPVIVLVRPQLGQNIGKAARAMLNFGLTELRLVAPRDGWPNPEAGPSASGADTVLENARVFETTAEAIADCSLVYASTVRRRDLVIPVVGPEEMANEIHSTEGRSAILFGPERAGLATDDVAVAGKIVTVPINPEFASLNLAQAVILLAYEWSRGAELSQPTAKELEPPASMGELDGLIGQLEADLETAGYFFPPDRIRATKTTLRTILTKPQWSSREIQALRGVIRALGDLRSSKN